MAGIHEQIVILRRPQNRRAIWCHRAQTGPSFGARDVAALGKEISDHMFHRIRGMRAETVGIARNFRRACNADAIAEAGDGDLMGFVHDCGLWGKRVVGDRQRDGITLDRIDRQLDPDGIQHVHRITSHGTNIGITGDTPGDLGIYACDLAILDRDGAD